MLPAHWPPSWALAVTPLPVLAPCCWGDIQASKAGDSRYWRFMTCWSYLIILSPPLRLWTQVCAPCLLPFTVHSCANSASGSSPLSSQWFLSPSFSKITLLLLSASFTFTWEPKFTPELGIPIPVSLGLQRESGPSTSRDRKSSGKPFRSSRVIFLSHFLLIIFSQVPAFKIKKKKLMLLW